MNGPLPTSRPGRVHGLPRWSDGPYFSMVGSGTGSQGIWASRARKYGAGCARVRRSVRSSGAAEAHLREVGQPALVEGFGVAHHVEQGRVVGRQRRRQDAAEGGDEVPRGDRVAVGPLGVGAQVEGVGEAVGRDLPALGHAGHGMQVARILGHQAFEERGDDALLGEARHELRVEIADFGADAAVEDLFAVAALDVGLAAGAGGNAASQRPEARQPEDERYGA